MSKTGQRNNTTISPGQRGESTEKKKQQEPQQREFFSPGYGSSLKNWRLPTLPLLRSTIGTIGL
ncbi:hypothetical protein, partial [Porphyromonas macacae]|uniref:hypothetical protein n=1 Tax=Porphyromonas macacae TaxID=28115 RepID=UPI0035A19001